MRLRGDRWPPERASGPSGALACYSSYAGYPPWSATVVVMHSGDWSGRASQKRVRSRCSHHVRVSIEWCAHSANARSCAIALAAPESRAAGAGVLAGSVAVMDAADGVLPEVATCWCAWPAAGTVLPAAGARKEDDATRAVAARSRARAVRIGFRKVSWRRGGETSAGAAGDDCNVSAVRLANITELGTGSAPFAAVAGPCPACQGSCHSRSKTLQLPGSAMKPATPIDATTTDIGRLKPLDRVKEKLGGVAASEATSCDTRSLLRVSGATIRSSLRIRSSSARRIAARHPLQSGTGRIAARPQTEHLM